MFFLNCYRSVLNEVMWLGSAVVLIPSILACETVSIRKYISSVIPDTFFRDVRMSSL